jgi:probable HAF family extracellular repeat protein
MKMRKLTFTALLLIASVPLALAQGTYTQIDYPGATLTEVTGIDSAGDLVGVYDVGVNNNGFLLSGGAYTTINYPGSTSTGLGGINDNGQIVGNARVNDIPTGFVYDTATQTFTTIVRPNTNWTVPSAINNAGTIVGVLNYGSGHLIGFELIGSKFTVIKPPTVKQALATGISAAGVVSGYTPTNNSFLFSDGKYVLLSIPNAVGAIASGISSAGLVGYYFTSNTDLGFLYQNKILTTLKFPGSGATYASGINDTGEVVGYFIDANLNAHGFTWTPPADAGKK